MKVALETHPFVYYIISNVMSGDYGSSPSVVTYTLKKGLNKTGLKL